MKYAKNLFRTRAAEPSILQRIVAVLKADLAPNRAAFGERSAAGGAARQMLFDSGENAIDLRVTAADGGFDGGTVLIGDASSAIDEMGGFRFEAIAAGEYVLTVRGETSEIVFEGLILK